MIDTGVRNIDGLRVLEPDVALALSHDWHSERDNADVVRLRVTEPEHWDALRSQGFVIKPTWVNWGAPLLASETEFVQRLSVKEQRNIRAGQRYVRDSPLDLVIRCPITEPDLEEFLGLYEAQIATMSHGVPYARLMQAQLLQAADRFLLVGARMGQELVGGCVCSLRPDQDVVRIAFAAALPGPRTAMVTRALYMRAAQAAREGGYGWLSLGSDPSLFGRVAKPGLFSFKSRLGFVPVPLSCLDPEDADAYDQAELILSLNALTDPALSLSYAAPLRTPNVTTWSQPPSWHLDVLSARNDVDIRPFAAPFLSSIAVVGVPMRS